MKDRVIQWSQLREQVGRVWGARSLSFNLGMWLVGSPTQVYREQSLRIAVFLFAQDLGCYMIVGLEGSGGAFGVLWPTGHRRTATRMLLYGMGEMIGHSAMYLTSDLNPTDR